MTVATFEAFDERDAATLDEAGAAVGVTVERRPEPGGDEEIVLIEHRDLTADDLARMPRLRTVLLLDRGRAGLPIDALAARSIPVRTVPNLGSLAVAEHAFALLLALKKRVLEAHQAVVGSVWRAGIDGPLLTDQRTYAFNWSGIEGPGWLYGETLGIVGFGRIGRAVAVRAQAFGMDVLYHNRNRLAASEERRLGVRYAALADLLAAADAVTLHLPFSAESEHLLGAPELARMKPGALLINLARGRVIDEAALVGALRRGELGGAGLDVLAFEPPARDNPILGLDNVVLSPHIGGTYNPIARREQLRLALRWAAAERRDHAAGGPAERAGAGRGTD